MELHSFLSINTCSTYTFKSNNLEQVYKSADSMQTFNAVTSNKNLVVKSRIKLSRKINKSSKLIIELLTYKADLKNDKPQI